MPSFLEMRTPRLLLTSVDMADLDDFHALHSDPDLYQHSPEAMNPDIEHSRSVIEGYEADWARTGLGYWSIRATDGSYLGCGGVRRDGLRGSPEGRGGDRGETWNVYYRLKKIAWGHGYAGEVVRVAARCAETIEADAVLQAVMRPCNQASEAVAKKLGMTFCGSQFDAGGTEELVYQLPAAEFG
jgi:RimJ/RimL family protein N-acetyltransferase